jgi:predicted glycoside hydrolase/deacetylase ChbG (UPF0249 family)
MSTRMPTAGIMRHLGLSASDRAVVLHADDIGMCSATIASYRQLVERPLPLSASAMVPCGWFPAVARLCREADSPLDIGIHLTLTSEWADYRWGPLTGAGAKTLCDGSGYFHPASSDVHEHACPDGAYLELRAQVDRARRLGVDITHLDSHMLTLMHPHLISTYMSLGDELGVPCCLARFCVDEWIADLDRRQLRPAVAFDAWSQLPLDAAEERLDVATRLLDAFPAGLSILLCHPATETAELRAIAPDWQARVADHRLYLDDRWVRVLERSGVKLVSMRAVGAALAKDRA